jgi:hypothetical protein
MLPGRIGLLSNAHLLALQAWRKCTTPEATRGSFLSKVSETANIFGNKKISIFERSRFPDLM